MHLVLTKGDDINVLCIDNRTGYFRLMENISVNRPEIAINMIADSVQGYKDDIVSDVNKVEELVSTKRDLDDKEFSVMGNSGYLFVDSIDHTGNIAQWISQNAVTYLETEDYALIVNENNRGVLVDDRYIVPFVANEDGNGTINVLGIQRYGQFDLETGRISEMMDNATNASLKTWVKTTDLESIIEADNPCGKIGALDMKNSMSLAWGEGQDFRNYVMDSGLAYNIESVPGGSVITVVLESDENKADAIMIRECGDTLSLSRIADVDGSMQFLGFEDFGNTYEGSIQLYQKIDDILCEKIEEADSGFSLDD